MHIYSAASIISNNMDTLKPLTAAYEAADGEAAIEAAAAIAKAIGYAIERIDFGVKDRLGRDIGCDITTAEGGGLWLASPQPTRNRRSYQAAGALLRFDSLAAREAWHKNYIRGASKRAAARAGK